METTITIIKENAPFAVMLLLAVLYLESNIDQFRAEIDQDLTGIRADISGLTERMARVESKIDGMDGRLSRIEGLLDDMRPLNIGAPGVQGMR